MSSFHKNNTVLHSKLGSSLSSSTNNFTSNSELNYLKPSDEEECNRSKAGTYTVDPEPSEVTEARKNIDSVFGTGGDECGSVEQDEPRASSFEFERVREWAESTSKLIPSSPAPDGETRFYLHDTQSLVSALQERMRLSNNNSRSELNSDSELDDKKLYTKPIYPLSSPHRKLPSHSKLGVEPKGVGREASVLSDSGYGLGYASDSSNEGNRLLNQVKYNRTFAIRRNRALGYESDGCNNNNNSNNTNASHITLTPRGMSTRPTPTPNHTPVANKQFERSDGGRFSLRLKPSTSPKPSQMTSPFPERKSSSGGGSHANHNHHLNAKTSSSLSISNNASKTSLTSKSKYLPPTPSLRPPNSINNGNNRGMMSSGHRSNSTLTAKEVELANWKRRKNYDPMKAAAQGKKKEINLAAVTSKIEPDKPFMKRSPASSTREQNIRLNPEGAGAMCKSYNESHYSAGGQSDDEIIGVLDELGSSVSNSPTHHHTQMQRSYHDDHTNNIYSSGPLTPSRKNKYEALDNLVIATIHSLSNKVRTSSRQLLERLYMQHSNEENGALMEEMISQLKELEVTSPNKSSSRELSGTLKNLKKIEQVILVLDKVLCDEDSEEEN